MSGILAKAVADVRRRRAQSGVVLVVTLFAALAATMSLTLMARSTAPFEAAFERANGAHLIIRVDAARVTLDELTTTAALPGVVEAGPAHPIAYVPFDLAGDKATMQVVGRDDPGGLDRPLLVAGRWPQTDTEIVVTRVQQAYPGQTLKASVGDTLLALSRPERPVFAVVGEAVDVGNSAYPPVNRAWVLSGALAGLTDAGRSRPGSEMAYRFERAATAEELAADLRTVRQALPAGAEMATPADWLTAKQGGFAWIVGFIGAALAAFTAFAVLAAVLVVANVVIGAVLAGYREIGMMKAIGFTPRGVAAVYVLQMLAPALAGGLVGVVGGVVASTSLLQMVGESVALPPPDAVFLPVDLGVLGGLLLVVAVAALAPALRAGRTNAVAALSVGAAPELGRVAWLGVRLQRVRLPVPLKLGAGNAFARPLRTVLILAAVLVGVAVLTASIGFQGTVSRALGDLSVVGMSQDVTVERYGAYPDEQVMATLEARPDTEAVVATASGSFLPDGAQHPLRATAFRGDAGALGYWAAEGRWFAAPGEALMTRAALDGAGLHLGDSVSGSLDGRPARIVVVGTFVDFMGSADLRIDWTTYQAAVAGTEPTSYLVQLRPGADAAAYAGAVQASDPAFLAARATDLVVITTTTDLIGSLFAALTAVLLLMALVGMFNTMTLTVRERAFEIAVLKGLGMTPLQVLAMVAASAAVLALAGAALGIPAGVAVHAAMIQSMSDYVGAGDLFGTAGDFGAPAVVLIVGLAIAVALLGAALPARWAARLPSARLMHAE